MLVTTIAQEAGSGRPVPAPKGKSHKFSDDLDFAGQNPVDRALIGDLRELIALPCIEPSVARPRHLKRPIDAW